MILAYARHLYAYSLYRLWKVGIIHGWGQTWAPYLLSYADFKANTLWRKAAKARAEEWKTMSKKKRSNAEYHARLLVLQTNYKDQ